MPINIQSLFSDIIETPAQKQRRLLEEGLVQASAIQPSSGLLRTGLATDIMRDMPRQREQFRRTAGGLVGLDLRTESEKLSDIIRTADASTPAKMINLSKAIQDYAPAQALTLRQAAIEEQQRLADRNRQIRLQNLQIEEAEREATEAQESKSVREDNAESYRQLGVPDALVNDYVAGNITSAQMNAAYSQRLSARARSAIEYKPVVGGELNNVKTAMADNEAVQELLSQKEGEWRVLGFPVPFTGENIFTEQDFIAEVSMIRQLHPELNESQAVDRAVSTLPTGGILSTLSRTDPETAESYRTQVVSSLQPMGAVNPAALAAGSGLETPEPSLERPEGSQELQDNAENLLSQVREFQLQQGTGPSMADSSAVSTEDQSIGGVNTFLDRMFGSSDRERAAYQRALQQRNGDTPPPVAGEQGEEETLDNVLKVIERKNFPLISSAAGQAREIPEYAESLKNLTNAVLATIQSREAISGAIDAGMKNTLRATGALVERLAEGQDVNVINSIERNIARMEQRMDDVVLPLQLKRELEQSIIAYRQIVDSAKQRFGSE